MAKPMRLRPSFFKIMLADFKSHLRIPPAFMKHVRGRMGAKAELRIVRGKKHLIEVETRPPHGHIYFAGGWHAFASRNSIVHGDFLVFFYDGASGFSILPFGTDGSEKKQSPATTGPLNSTNREKIPSKMSMKMPLPLPRKREKREPPLIEDGLFVDNAERPAFRPANPYFAFIFSHLYINRLRIPRWLVNEYGLWNKKYVVFEDPTAITWTVKLYRRRDGRMEFTNGWIDFHKGNHLKNGDICIFEIFDGAKILKFSVMSANKEIDAQEIMSSQDGEGSFPNIKLIEGNCVMNGDDAQMNELIEFDGDGHQVGEGSLAVVKYKDETLLVNAGVSIEEDSMVNCDVQMKEKRSILSVGERIHRDEESYLDVQPDVDAPLTHVAISMEEENLMPDGELHGGKENLLNFEPQEENVLIEGTSTIINDMEMQKDKGSSHYAQKKKKASRRGFAKMKDKSCASDGREGLDDGKGNDLNFQPLIKKPLRDGDIQLNEETPIANCGEHIEDATTETANPHFSRTFGASYYNVDIPKALVTKLGLKHRQNMVVKDFSGESYRARLAKRPNGSIALVDGWYACAKKNAVASGDTCNFEFIGTSELLLRIVRGGQN